MIQELGSADQCIDALSDITPLRPPTRPQTLTETNTNNTHTHTHTHTHTNIYKFNYSLSALNFKTYV